MYVFLRPMLLLILAFFVSTTLTLPASEASAIMTFSYGVHYPNGNAAVNYIYGPDGTWKSLTKIEYTWNYYPKYATLYHPQDQNTLFNYANGAHFTTTPDANGHLLFDVNHTGELNMIAGSAAFYEHNGKGASNQTLAKPFTNFWFDDNWLARYMSQAYARPEPYGLSDYPDFTRWQILSGNTDGWSPYNRDYFDTLALDGLYFLAKGDYQLAFKNWQRLRDKSGYYYDEANQRFQYPNISENYHLGLFKILTDKLLNTSKSYQQDELLQHSIALRSNILSNQEQSQGQLFGWTSSIGNTHSLINTETVAVNVLALGAGGKFSYEAGKPPFVMDGHFFQRVHNVLSAVKRFSQPGFMTEGPVAQLPIGSFSVDFFLRAAEPTGTMAHLSVRDADTNTVLAETDVKGADLANNNQWTRLSLNFTLTSAQNHLEFRTYWNGTASMDIAYIQIR